MVNNYSDIDILISKFLSGEADPEEAIFLEDWKAESPDNLQYFLDSEKLFLLTQDESRQEINVSAAWEKVAPQLEEKPKAKIFKLNPTFLRMAASFLILIGIGGSVGFWLMNQSGEQIFASNEKPQNFELRDGSQIQVATNSSVSVGKDFGKTNRLVKLKGSAYFTVDHNEKMPFIIDAGEVFIKDLGTKFNVVSVHDTLFVTVDEGIVSIYDKTGEEETLKAGESAYYVKSEKKLFASTNAQQPVSADSKPEGEVKQQIVKLNFSNTKLNEVIKRLDKAYGTKVELQNNSLSNLTITTKFENEELEVVLTIITETLGLKYQKTDKGYLILATK